MASLVAYIQRLRIKLLAYNEAAEANIRLYDAERSRLVLNNPAEPHQSKALRDSPELNVYGNRVTFNTAQSNRMALTIMALVAARELEVQNAQAQSPTDAGPPRPA